MSKSIVDKINENILDLGVMTNDVNEFVLNKLVDYFKPEIGVLYIANIFRENNEPCNRFLPQIAIDSRGNTNWKYRADRSDFNDDIELLEKNKVLVQYEYGKEDEETYYYLDREKITEAGRDSQLNSLKNDESKDCIKRAVTHFQNMEEKSKDLLKEVITAGCIDVFDNGKNYDLDEYSGEQYTRNEIIIIPVKQTLKLESCIEKEIVAIFVIEKPSAHSDEIPALLEKLRTQCSLLFKFTARISDKKCWIRTFKKLLQVSTENFTGVYKDILFFLASLNPTTFTSYWSYIEFDQLVGGKHDNPLWTKESSVQYKNGKGPIEVSYDLEESYLIADERDISIVEYTKKIKKIMGEHSGNELGSKDYFLGFKDPVKKSQVKATLNYSELWNLINADKMYLVPILKEINGGEDKEGKSKQELRGLLSIFPFKEYKNLLFYNKEVLQALSKSISCVIDYMLIETKDKITTEIRKQSGNYLSDFRDFLDKVISDVIKKFMNVDGCSIFYYSDLYKRLDLYASTGIKDKDDNLVEKRDYVKVFYCKDDDDDDRTTWQVYDKGKANNLFFNADEKRAKYSEDFKITHGSKVSSLILPIRSVIEPGKVLGVIRFTNLKKKFNVKGDGKERVIPFSSDYVEVCEYIAQILGHYYVAYLYYSRFHNFFKIMPHEMYQPLQTLGFRVDDLKKKIPALAAILDKDKKSKDIVDDIENTIEGIKFFAYDNPLIIAGADISIKRELDYVYDRLIFKWVNSLKRVAEKNGLQIIYDPMQVNNIPKVNLDFKRVEHIIFNLLNNAIQYSCSDSVIKIDTAFDYVAQKLTIKVTNIGISIDDNDYEKIFDYGYRCNEALHCKESGLGIGLYVARKIARAHVGDIVPDSKKILGYNVSYLKALEKIDNSTLKKEYESEFIEVRKLEEDGFLKDVTTTYFSEVIVKRYIDSDYKDKEIGLLVKRPINKTVFTVTLSTEMEKP